VEIFRRSRDRAMSLFVCVLLYVMVCVCGDDFCVCMYVYSYILYVCVSYVLFVVAKANIYLYTRRILTKRIRLTTQCNS